MGVLKNLFVEKISNEQRPATATRRSAGRFVGAATAFLSRRAVRPGTFGFTFQASSIFSFKRNHDHQLVRSVLLGLSASTSASHVSWPPGQTGKCPYRETWSLYKRLPKPTFLEDFTCYRGVTVPKGSNM